MLTVKQLARLAGVTPRTLHHYDAIGLLKPSRIGANGYRYYDADAVLRLQQILFYRELDMPLEDIGRIMSQPGYDAMQALQGHRDALRQRVKRLNHLVQTVDRTILHLKGGRPMEPKDFFAGFTEEEEKKYTEEALRTYDPETVKASSARWKAYSKAEKQRIGEEAKAVYEELLAAIPEGAASRKAQAAVEHWRKHMQYFWSPNDEQLAGLADLYNEDARFRANFDRLSPQLAPFMREAVRVYVERAAKK